MPQHIRVISFNTNKIYANIKQISKKCVADHSLMQTGRERDTIIVVFFVHEIWTYCN